MLHFVSGFLFATCSFILSVTPGEGALSAAITPFFRIFPAFNLGEGLLSLVTLSFNVPLPPPAPPPPMLANVTARAGAAATSSDVAGSLSPIPVKGGPSSPFDWHVLGRPITLLAAQWVGFALLLLLLESNVARTACDAAGRLRSRATSWRCAAEAAPPSCDEESAPLAPPPAVLGGGDDDGGPGVAEERLRAGRAAAAHHPGARDAASLLDVCKAFPAAGSARSVTALDRVTLGVPPGARLALLGPNGAGAPAQPPLGDRSRSVVRM